MRRQKEHAGFTLYELMITLAVASIILTFGVPGFQNFVQNSRAVTHTNDMITALNLARSEATRRSRPIDVCASSNGTSCSGSTDWSAGWVVRIPGGEILRIWPARSGGANVLTGTVSTIQFQARGALAAGAAPSFAVQLPYCHDTGRRAITVNVAGRIAVNRVACI